MQPCPACGKSTSDSARFCEHCGAPVTGVPSGNAELADRVRRLLADGQKIEAIKVLHEATGAGLAEAKQAVEAIQLGEIYKADGLDEGLEGDLLRLLQAGRKIEAIQRYRERNPCGLKEAKDFVEALAAQHGIVAIRGGCLGVVLGLMIAFVVAAACVARADEATISSGEQSVEGWITHTVESEFQAKPTEIRVLLPDKLDTTKRNLVLYVLPVEAARESRYGDGLAEVKRGGLHNKHGLICVAPTFAHLPCTRTIRRTRRSGRRPISQRSSSRSLTERMQFVPPKKLAGCSASANRAGARGACSPAIPICSERPLRGMPRSTCRVSTSTVPRRSSALKNTSRRTACYLR